MKQLDALSVYQMQYANIEMQPLVIAEDREWARNGAMFAANVPTVGDVMQYNGQLALLRRMYPSLFNRFAAEFPRVRNFI